jgi:hypothetical protein
MHVPSVIGSVALHVSRPQQGCPPATQGPSSTLHGMASHAVVAGSQKPVQHVEPSLHSKPTGAQSSPQTPSRQTWVQQSFASTHASPASLHSTPPHVPVLRSHSPAPGQHGLFSEQLTPFGEQHWLV